MCVVVFWGDWGGGRGAGGQQTTFLALAKGLRLSEVLFRSLLYAVAVGLPFLITCYAQHTKSTITHAYTTEAEGDQTL